MSGSLAATGSSSATSQLALTSGAALAIGAGAVFVARRRKAGFPRLTREAGCRSGTPAHALTAQRARHRTVSGPLR